MSYHLSPESAQLDELIETIECRIPNLLFREQQWNLRNIVASWHNQHFVSEKITKRRLRKQLIPALRLLIEARRPMSSIEISALANKENDKRTQSPYARFPELRLWGLIRCFRTDENEEVWIATDAGKHFVGGAISAPEFIYTQNRDGKLVRVETPEGEKEPERIFVEEIVRYKVEEEPEPDDSCMAMAASQSSFLDN